MKNKHACSIIVPTHNAPHDLAELLESLRGQLQKSDEVIIVDDGSLPVHRKALVEVIQRAALTQVALIQKSHTGLGGNWNVAVRKSKNPFLLFINDDSSADSQWLEGMRGSLIKAEAVQGNYWTQAITSNLDRQHMLWRTAVGQAKRNDFPECFGVHTRNFGIRKDVLLASCGQPPFPARTYPNASEDILLGERLLKHGVKIVMNADAIVTDIGDEHTLKTILRKKYAHGRNDALVCKLGADTFGFGNFRRAVITPVKAGVHIYAALLFWFFYTWGAMTGKIMLLMGRKGEVQA